MFKSLVRLSLCTLALLPITVPEAMSAEQIPYSALAPHRVTGSLGKPLGTLVKIEATVMGDSGSKADAGKTLLKIDKLDGKPLARPVTLAAAYFSFTHIPQPKPGSRVSYHGYESGGFTGIPSASFAHMPAVATQELHFELFFQVVKGS